MHRTSSPLESLMPFPLKASKAANDEADNVYHHAPPPRPPPTPALEAGNMKASGGLNSLKSLITCGKKPEKPENMHLAWGRERKGEQELNPQPEKLNPTPSKLNPKPEKLNPKPEKLDS